ncbi:MAG: hypothetical protein WAX04_01440 [Oscillospiraceae bacterium]
MLYVNDLPDIVKCGVKMFADDTKIWNKVKDIGDKDRLQNDLDNLDLWSSKWLLKFNVDKCKMMSLGHTLGTEYTLGGKVLQNTEEEKDLGVWISSNLKPSLQCSKAALKAKSVLACIKRTFSSITIDSFKILFNTYIRPHIEYCVQVWNPFLKKDIEILENVQRRATKMVKALGKMSYEERLAKLKLFPLSYRRKRGDMIEVFKIMNGIDNIDREAFFSDSVTKNLRGHSCKLYHRQVRLQLRQGFFSQRVVSLWNSLPQFVVESTSVDMFKGRLDKFVFGSEVGTKNFI